MSKLPASPEDRANRAVLGLFNGQVVAATRPHTIVLVAQAIRDAVAEEKAEVERLLEANSELVLALRGLIMSADAMWEDKNLGHDWPEACAAARMALRKYQRG